MVEAKITRVVGYLKKLLQEKGIFPERIVLFGSYAKGKITKDSDLDLVIVSPDFRGKGILARAEMLSGIEWQLIDKYPYSLDLITMTPEEWEKGDSLIAEFAKEGVGY